MKNDTIRWVFYAERYFVINCLIEQVKTTVATICMDEPILYWLQWHEGLK